MGTRIVANFVLKKVCCVRSVEIAAQEHKDVSLWFLCSGVAARLAKAECLLSLGWHELLESTQSCLKIYKRLHGVFCESFILGKV